MLAVIYVMPYADILQTHNIERMQTAVSLCRGMSTAQWHCLSTNQPDVQRRGPL
jgi:hypothetical protein